MKEISDGFALLSSEDYGFALFSSEDYICRSEHRVRR